MNKNQRIAIWIISVLSLVLSVVAVFISCVRIKPLNVDGVSLLTIIFTKNPNNHIICVTNTNNEIPDKLS